MRRLTKLIGLARRRVVVGLARIKQAQRPPQQPIRHTAPLAAAIAWILVTALIGCEREEAIVYRVPEVVGVVQMLDTGQADGLVWTFADGTRLVVDRHNSYYLKGGSPTQGALLLSGDDDGRTWVVGFRLTRTRGLPPDCYELFTTGRDDGGAVAMDVGLLLRKGPDFDPGPATEGRYSYATGSFCLNELGEVTSYQP